MKLSLLILLLLAVSTVRPAYAEEINLSLSPSTIQIIASPGDSVQIPVSLTNKGTQTQSLSILFKPFTGLLPDGAIDFAAKDTPAFPFTLTKDEETLGDFIDVRSYETAELMLLVQIPKDAAVLDHYTTLLFQTRNKGTVSADQTASSIEAAVGTHILLSVKGDGEQEQLRAKITEFQTNQFVTTDDPIAFTLVVQNEGKHFIQTTARIDLVDPANNPIKTIAMPVSTILAASSRNLTHETSTISPRELFGKYQAKATVTIGDQVLTKTLALYVIPKDVLMTTLGILLAAVFIISRVRFYVLKNRRLSHQKRKK